MRHIFDKEFMEGFLETCLSLGFDKSASVNIFRKFVPGEMAKKAEVFLTSMEKVAAIGSELPGYVPGINAPVGSTELDPATYAARQSAIQSGISKATQGKNVLDPRVTRPLTSGQTDISRNEYFQARQEQLQKEREANSPWQIWGREMLYNNPIATALRSGTGGMDYNVARAKNWWRSAQNKLFNSNYYDMEKLPEKSPQYVNTYAKPENPVVSEYETSRKNLRDVYNITPEEMQAHLQHQELLRRAGLNPFDPASAEKYRQMQEQNRRWQTSGNSIWAASNRRLPPSPASMAVSPLTGRTVPGGEQFTQPSFYRRW